MGSFGSMEEAEESSLLFGDDAVGALRDCCASKMPCVPYLSQSEEFQYMRMAVQKCYCQRRCTPTRNILENLKNIENKISKHSVRSDSLNASRIRRFTDIYVYLLKELIMAKQRKQKTNTFKNKRQECQLKFQELGKFSQLIS